MKRLTKRTAGERRYRALKRKVEAAISHLDTAQYYLKERERDGLSQQPVRLMQSITEAKEGLKS